MKMLHRFTLGTVAAALLLTLAACAGGFSAQDRNTAVGAGVGAVLTGGSPAGAAVGGIIGHGIGTPETEEPK